MSFRRQSVLFIRYSLRPSRNTRRVMAISLKSTFRDFSQSAMVSVTSAKPTGLRLSVPLKITSAISSPRRALAEVSPSTQRMASTTLLLPQPFGPTMPVTPVANSKWVLSAKDLNPNRSRLLRYMVESGNHWPRNGQPESNRDATASGKHKPNLFPHLGDT